MKSERAREHLKSIVQNNGLGAINRAIAEAVTKAVELAEEDAEIRQKAEDREKAIKAYCRSMCSRDGGQECLCADFLDFINRYDNE